MSFVFPSWETAFSPSFHEDAKAMLEAALNKGNKPPVIQGHIEVKELSMGTQPPTLTLLEIGDLSLDRFRGILRLGYQGDAWLEVRCRVQANPLSHNPNLLPSSILPLSTPLAASQPLLVPMTLRLSRLHLRAILILVVSASKGITLVFKNDPLQNVDVSSTFDSVEVIRGYLQQEIEGQLREMFREDLPGIIHRLSQRWLGGSSTGGKVELQYKDGGDPSSGLGTPGKADEDEDEVDPNDPFAEKEIFPPYKPSTASPAINVNLTPRRRAMQQAARARRMSSSAVSESPTSHTIFPDIEDYDPTYGLRPEGVPTHSGYEAFGRLWEKARQGEGRGLGSLMHSTVHEEDQDRGDVSDEDWDEDEDGSRSLDMVEMEDALKVVKPSTSRSSGRASAGGGSRYGDEDIVEWEMFPAVGGGMITRPRVYHSQSKIRAPSDAGIAMPSPSATGTGGSVTARASSVGGASSTIGSFKTRPIPPPGTPLFHPARTGFNQSVAGPGPSSLRRMVTSRSDVFTSNHRSTRSEAFIQLPPSKSQRSGLSRQLSNVTNTAGTGSSSAARSSSWGTGGTGTDLRTSTRSNTVSTMASSQLPSSKSMSAVIHIKSSAYSPSKSVTGVGLGLGHDRRTSFSMTGTSPGTATGTSFPPRNMTGLSSITIPLNNSVSQLATLSHSNHTLSPYARGHEHIAVRSFPHLGRSNTSASLQGSHGMPGYNHAGAGAMSYNQTGAGSDGTGVKARRKRIYRLGSKKTNNSNGKGGGGDSTPLSPDLDDTPPRSDQYSSSEDYSRRLSFTSAPNLYNNNNHFPTHPSLTGLAQRVMRPNLARSPDSRTSYGFPAVGGR